MKNQTLRNVFNHLGTMVLGAGLIPMYYYWNNYPQLGAKNTLIAIAIFILVYLAVSLIFKLIFRNTPTAIFMLYTAWSIFWFGFPIVRSLRDHGYFLLIQAHDLQWMALVICSCLGFGIIYVFSQYCNGVVVKLNCVFYHICLYSALYTRCSDWTTSGTTYKFSRPF